MTVGTFDRVRALAALDLLGGRLDAHDENEAVMTADEYRLAAQRVRSLGQLVGRSQDGLEVMSRSESLCELLAELGSLDEAKAVFLSISLGS